MATNLQTNFRRITADSLLDDKGQPPPSWFLNFLSNYNLTGQNTAILLNQGLTIGNNLCGQFYPSSGYFTFTTGATYTTKNTFTPITFAWTGANVKAPSGVFISYLRQSNNSPIINAVSLQWQPINSNQSIQIDFIAGLSNSTTYNATFLVL